jgi:hypothetical protein
MKQASQQVGGMRKITSQCETNWMNTVKQALAASKKIAKSRSQSS